MQQAPTLEVTVVAEPSQEELDAARARRKAILNSIGAKLESDKNEAVLGRTDIERRWIQNIRQTYPIETPTQDSKGNINIEPHRRSNDNITAQAVKLTAARISDMLFPTNGDNWTIEPTPIPELVNPGQPVAQDPQTGQPVTAAAMAAAEREVARARASRMRRHISDQLQECRYAAEGRAAIWDACLLGTGIIKGPFVRASTRKSFQTIGVVNGAAVHSLQVVQDNKPAAKRVDPWDFYPQPSRKIGEAEHAFELHLLNRKQVRVLAKQPGFDPEQINELLGMEPNLGTLSNSVFINRSGLQSNSQDAIRDRYPVWEYHGPIPRECLEELGVPLDPDDHMTVYDGEVWFSMGVVLKAALSHVDGCDDLPYYVFCYEDDPTDIFGLGVPDLCRDDQIAANMLWHAIMLNSMMSSGPQIGVLKGAMQAQDGRYDFSCLGPRVWPMTDDGVKIGDAMSVFTIPNVTAPLLNVHDRVKQNAEEHTMLPFMGQGEPTSTVPTSSGLAMLMNQANVVQRRAAKRWDDDITIPMLTAFYYWNMLYGQDPEAKGDYNVIARGSSHLLVKDLQAQNFFFLSNLVKDPAWAPYFDMPGFAKKALDIMDFDTDGLLKPLEQVQAEAQQAQQAPPDPRIVAAKIEQQTKMAELEFQREKLAVDAQTEAQKAQADVLVAQMNMDAKAMELAANKDIALAELYAKGNMHERTLQTKEFMASAKLRLDAQKIVDKRESQILQTKVESPVRLAG